MDYAMDRMMMGTLIMFERILHLPRLMTKFRSVQGVHGSISQKSFSLDIVTPAVRDSFDDGKRAFGTLRHYMEGDLKAV